MNYDKFQDKIFKDSYVALPYIERSVVNNSVIPRISNIIYVVYHVDNGVISAYDELSEAEKDVVIYIKENYDYDNLIEDYFDMTPKRIKEIVSDFIGIIDVKGIILNERRW